MPALTLKTVASAAESKDHHPGATTATATSTATATYTMSNMMEENAALRRRIKDLERDDGASHSEPSVASAESREQTTELLVLRKDLARVENEKANQELEFMNQLSAAAREYEQIIDELKSQLALSEADKETMKNAPRPHASDDETEEYLAAQEAAMHKLREDLIAADKEADVHKRDVNRLAKKLRENDGERKALLEDVSDLRQKLVTASRERKSIEENMMDLERHYNAKFETLEDEIAERATAEEKREVDMGNMNDHIIALEDKKVLLLDEITDVRMQLDRADQDNQELRRQVEELRRQKAEAHFQHPQNDGGEREDQEQLAQLEQTISSLREELCCVTSSYKTDIKRLEEQLAGKHREVDELKEAVSTKTAMLAVEQSRCAAMTIELKESKQELQKELKTTSDREREIATLETQRISYEHRASNCIMEHVAEVDSIKEENAILREEVHQLRRQLETSEKRAAAKGKQSSAFSSSLSPREQMPSQSETNKNNSNKPIWASAKPSHVKNQNRSWNPTGGKLASPPGSPPTTTREGSGSGSAQNPSSNSESPNRNSVKALAASFEKTRPRSATSPRTTPTASESVSVRPFTGADSEELEQELLRRNQEIEDLHNLMESELKRKMEEIEELQSLLDSGVQQSQELKEKLKMQAEYIGQLKAEIATLNATKAAADSLSRQEQERKSAADKAEIERTKAQLELIRRQLDAETLSCHEKERKCVAQEAEIRRIVSQLELTQRQLDAEHQQHHGNAAADKAEIERIRGELKLTRQKLETEAERARELAKAVEEMEQLRDDVELAQSSRKAHESELESLKSQLTQELLEKKKLDIAHKGQMKELEDTIEELNIECDKELEEKQSELVSLQQKLRDQEEEVRRLQGEKQELCVNMNSTQSQKRTEIDSLQADLLSKEAENTQLLRDVKSLEMQVHDNLFHSEELTALRKKVKELESIETRQAATHNHMHQMEVEGLHSENNKLRESVRKAMIEKRAMQEKINSMVTDQEKSTTMKVLRERNESLKKEVEKLTRKLQQYQKQNKTRVSTRIEV